MDDKSVEKRLQLVKEKLQTEIFSVERLIYLKSIDSTNAELKRRIVEGAVSGTVVWAEEQTAGRGRLDRKWSSAAEKGIACSVLLECSDIQNAFQYSFVTAVAVAEGIAKTTGLAPQLKWPNDVLLAKKKVCGILLELTGQYLIIGFGLNVNQKQEDFPEDLKEKAVSLALLMDCDLAREEILAEILNSLERNHLLMQQRGFKAIAEKWTQLCAIIGADVIVSGAGQTVLEGTVLGLREDGALLLQTEKGAEAIISGDVSLRGKNTNYI